MHSLSRPLIRLFTTTLLVAAVALAVVTHAQAAAASAPDGDTSTTMMMVSQDRPNAPRHEVPIRDGGVSAARAGEPDLAGLRLPLLSKRRQQVRRLLRVLDASGPTGHHLVAQLRREGTAVRVGDLSAIGAAGLYDYGRQRLVLDARLIVTTDTNELVEVIAHEAGHNAFERRGNFDRLEALGTSTLGTYVLNETFADAVADQVLSDLGERRRYGSVWGDFRWHLDSPYYRDYYGIDDAEAKLIRRQAPAAIRALFADLAAYGVSTRYVRAGLPA